MSPRHITPHAALKRINVGGIVVASTAVGAAAVVALISADPAQSSPAPAPHARTAAAAITPPSAQAATVHRIPVPGKGIFAAKQRAKKQLPSAADAVKLAVSQVGTTEGATGGSKFNRWFMSTPYARQGVQRDGGSVSDYANASWCDMFVSWVGNRLGVKGMGADAFTPEHAKWFKSQGRWGQTPKPGAVVFFSWSGGDIDSIDHVGMVIKDNRDGTVQTVEGNTDDAVKIRTRETDTIVGYGYPQYAQ